MWDVDVPMKALGEEELAVVRATDRSALAPLSEDELVELHTRVRRARNKYVGQYRRQGAARVAAVGARGKDRAAGRAAERAEVFEAALARVSTALATAARRSAAELKAERLAAARAVRSAGPSAPGAASLEVPTPTASPKRAPQKSGGRKKRDASSIAQGKRRQARRDTR